MPLSRPSLEELVNRAQSEIKSSLSQGFTVLRKNTIKILGKTLGVLAHILFGYIENIVRELFVTTCITEEYLIIHAKENDVPRKAATYAQGTVRFSGTHGSTIMQDTIIQSDNGTQFRVNETAVIGTTLYTDVNVVAIESGLTGNVVESETMYLLTEIGGVNNEGVSGGLTGGSDIESFASWKSRIIAKKQHIALGGTIEEWVDWVKNNPTFSPTRVWIQPRYAGPRTIGIYYVFDNQDDILPNTSNMLSISSYLDTLRPINTIPYILAPNLVYVSLTILLNPLSQSLIDAVNSALIELFRNNSDIPGTYIDNSTVAKPLLISDIRSAIDYASGTADNEIEEIRINGTVVNLDDIVVNEGELAVFDTENTEYELRI